ncbi:uncharacterized protein LOC121381419 [Gigantopelta aegis]|uniref:uncharacterized protein LOC121381419 n=1 Tax=Gigantopelta aegis TaxID=1735272 RepID=UPI001B8888CB|nr:uncharacterized protein LOC121381419 [Gigantopelta aegis]
MEKQGPIPSDAPPSYDKQGETAMRRNPPMTYPAYAAQSYSAQNEYVVVTQPYPNAITINVPVPDYTRLAIFATIFCCLPLGIFAILRAQDARRAAARDDPVIGIQLAGSSKRLSIIAIACGILLLVPATCVLIWYFAEGNSACYRYFC